MVWFSIGMSVAIGLITAGFLSINMVFIDAMPVILVSGIVSCITCALMFATLAKSANTGNQKMTGKRSYVRNYEEL